MGRCGCSPLAFAADPSSKGAVIAKVLPLPVQQGAVRSRGYVWLHIALTLVLLFAAMHPHAGGAAAPLGAADASVEASFTQLVDWGPDEAPQAPDGGSACAGSCKVELAVPAHFVAPAYIPVVRAGWPVLDDQWAQVTRPSRLERPPRA